MCVNINITLPMLKKFFMLYPLLWGVWITLVWTAIRAMLVCAFLLVGIPVIYLGGNSEFQDKYILTRNSTDDATEELSVYYTYASLLVVETTLITHTVLNLPYGLVRKRSIFVKQYLACRLVVWLLEILLIFVMCVIHTVLLGWYLITLMVIILEFYGIIVVHSYYWILLGEERERRCKHIDDLFERRRDDCPYCNDL